MSKKSAKHQEFEDSLREQEKYENSREYLVDKIKYLEKETERLEGRIRNIEEHLNIRYVGFDD